MYIQLTVEKNASLWQKIKESHAINRRNVFYIHTHTYIEKPYHKEIKKYFLRILIKIYAWEEMQGVLSRQKF